MVAFHDLVLMASALHEWPQGPVHALLSLNNGCICPLDIGDTQAELASNCVRTFLGPHSLFSLFKYLFLALSDEFHLFVKCGPQ